MSFTSHVPQMQFNWQSGEGVESPLRSEELAILDLLRQIRSYDEPIKATATDNIIEIIKSAHEGKENPALIEQIKSQLVPALFDLTKQWTVDGEEMHLCSEINAVTAICQVAAHLERYEKHWVYYGFLPNFSSLLVHPSSMARKFAMAHLVDFANYFGDTFTENCLLPHFLSGCSDEKHRVRKVCADQFGDIARRCNAAIRHTQLTTVYLKLLEDHEKMVHMATASQIGPFIATFADSKRTGLTLADGKLVHVEEEKIVATETDWEMPPPDPEIRHSTLIDSPSTLQVPSLTLECECDHQSANTSLTCHCPRSIPIGSESDWSQPPPDFLMPGEENRRAVESYSSDDEDVFPSTPRRTISSFNPGCMLALAEDFDELEEDECGNLNQSFVGDDLYDDDEGGNFFVKGVGIPRIDITEDGEDEKVEEDALEMSVDEEDEDTVAETQSTERSLAVVPASSQLLTIGLIKWNFSSSLRQSYTFSTPPNLFKSSKLSHRVSPLEHKVSPTTLAIAAADNDVEMMNETENGFSVDLLPEFPESKSPRSETPNVKIKPSTPTGGSKIGRRLSPTSLAIAAAEGEEAVNEVVDAQLSPQTSDTKPSPMAGTMDVLRQGINRFVSNKAKNMFQNFAPTFKLAAPTNQKKSETITRTPEPPVSPLRPRRLFGSPKRVASTDLLDSPQDPKRIRVNGEEDSQVVPSRIHWPMSRMLESHSSISTPRNKRKKTKKSEEEQRVADFYLCSFSPDTLIGADGVERFLTSDEQQVYFNIEQDVIPQQLLESLATFQTDDLDRLTDSHNSILARAFPAIAFTFGAERWLYIKAIYMSLANSPHVSVRCSISQSLHEIAQILGRELADRDLVPVFRTYMQSDTADVQFGLLSNLAAFFAVISEQKRLELADQLPRFRTVDTNTQWRVRNVFIEQLTALVDLYKPYPVNSHLTPFALSFATDRTAEVRRSAVQMLAKIVAKFIIYEQEACRSSGRPTDALDSTPLTRELLEEFTRGFAESKSWRKRQTYAMLLECLLRSELLDVTTFSTLFKGQVMALAVDDVHNVRQYFCQIAQLLRTVRLEEIDSELYVHVRDRLHDLAASDRDLEIKVQARIALGTVDAETDEVDLTSRRLEESEA
ncbi:Serine/threonine-protein phosphatase 4 regulatory subunit 1 [Aphelenchoides besseyi]|nr:Serine/threonine-protein phosphatase 4 regulatory subunit 1 [Aphelenchoides besseyi]